MNAVSLPKLPDLVEACSDLGVETLTVCTLPPDLRLASPRDAVALTDALTTVAAHLDCDVSLLGRRYYLPDGLAAALMQSSRPGLRLRLAVDYACRPSFLQAGPLAGHASVLLLPRGLEPGNLLRWHFARARRVEADWQRFNPATFPALLSRRPLLLPRSLIATR
jgi:hypothetical protein